MKNQKEINKNKSIEEKTENKNLDEKRREMLSKLTKLSFIAPVTLATMSMKANACSVTC